jgi:hypothetical protein
MPRVKGREAVAFTRETELRETVVQALRRLPRSSTKRTAAIETVFSLMANEPRTHEHSIDVLMAGRAWRSCFETSRA